MNLWRDDFQRSWHVAFLSFWTLRYAYICQYNTHFNENECKTSSGVESANAPQRKVGGDEKHGGEEEEARGREGSLWTCLSLPWNDRTLSYSFYELFEKFDSLRRTPPPPPGLGRSNLFYPVSCSLSHSCQYSRFTVIGNFDRYSVLLSRVAWWIRGQQTPITYLRRMRHDNVSVLRD